MLLIITNRDDFASDYLVHRLQEKNVPFARFNTDQYPEEVAIDFEFRKDRFNYTLTISGKTINSGDITSVYFRQPHIPKIKEEESVA